MGFDKFTNLSPDDVLKYFNVDIENGLDNETVKSLLRKYGRNILERNNNTITSIFLRQFKSAFIYLLIVASIITFILGEYLDTVFILFFVFINVFLGFYQEYKSEQTIKYLNKFANKRATVIRQGKEATIDAGELVPGDVVVLETGDIIPADIRIVRNNNITVNESTLTGESIDIRKEEKQLSISGNDIYKANNILFSGTTVVEGKALGVVIFTGKDTQLGNISKLATQIEEVSPFEVQINKFSKFILFLTVITLLLVFIVHLIFKDTLSIFDLIIYSIALAVGVIPEAMPLVTTFSLSLGAKKLAQKKVIVKRLSAIEDLGDISVLCTDKTGTITQNKLTVSNIYSSNNTELLELGINACSSLDTQGTPNNSFDIAILNKIGSENMDRIKNIKRIFEIPFDPNRRRNSVLIKDKDKNTLIIRGSAESILPHIRNLSSAENEKIMKWIIKEGTEGKRVLAIAKKDILSNTYTVNEEENNPNFVGLISFEDPIKESTYDALSKAKYLGISTKIITGDSLEVALAVGSKLGLVKNNNDGITGDEFEKLSIEDQKNTAKELNVFARMSPVQKYNFIKILQEDAKVGFLGEGINDSPALKASGVSIVVDKASDVSREVADIILLEPDLKSIIDGIELGRKTFINVTNYIKATLASNFGNFYAMAFVTLIIDYLPMLPVQILLVNLLSDFPMISIATDNVDQEDIKNPKKSSIKDILLMATVLGLISTIFDFVFFSIFRSEGEKSLQTYWFIGSILTELILIYSIRTKKWLFKVKNMPSSSIIFLTIIAALATIFIPFTTLGTQLFQFIVPSFDKLLLVLLVLIGYLISTELAKRMYIKYLSVVR